MLMALTRGTSSVHAESQRQVYPIGYILQVISDGVPAACAAPIRCLHRIARGPVVWGRLAPSGRALVRFAQRPVVS